MRASLESAFAFLITWAALIDAALSIAGIAVAIILIRRVTNG